MREVCFRAIGNKDGFIPVCCVVNYHEYSFLVRLCVCRSKEGEGQKMSEEVWVGRFFGLSVYF